MALPNFEDLVPTENSSYPRFEDLVADAPVEVSKGESLLRGAGQGVSLGFADEATGLLEAIKDAVSNGHTNLKQVVADYAKHRDESRQAYSEAREANPKTYMAGELGGAAGTMLIPGANAAMGIKGMAAIGALQGLGSSEADLTEGDIAPAVKDVAVGGAIGAGTGLAMKGVEKVVKGAGRMFTDHADDVLKKVGKIGASVPEEATERYLSNPKAVNSGMSRQELAETMIGPNHDSAYKQIEEAISKADGEAWKVLSKSPSIPKIEVIERGQKLVKDILGGNISEDFSQELTRESGVGASAKVLSAINDELGKINEAFGDTISEADLKSVVHDIQKLSYAEAGNPKGSLAAEGLRKLSGVLNDVLKQRNPEYARRMVPVANAMETLKRFEGLFVNKQNPEFMNKAIEKLSRLNNESGSKTGDIKNVFDEVKSITGFDLEDQAKNTFAKEAFNKTDTNGSRKTVLGSVMGSALGTVLPGGPIVGAAVGSALGFSGDKVAGHAFKSLLNGKIALDKVTPELTRSLGKFAKPIMEAAKRGGSELAVTHYVLQQTNPEYRQLTDSMLNENK